MIHHRPHGIDDPYKRLPTERYPRDPVEGDAPQIGFRVSAPAQEAWVALVRDGDPVRSPVRSPETIPAQPLGGGLWSAQLPALDAGSHAYTIFAGLPDREVASDPYALPVARSHRVQRVEDVRITERGVVLALASDRQGRARLDIDVPRAGTCRFHLRPSPPAGHDAAAPEAATSQGAAITADRSGDRLTLRGPGITLRIDLASLHYEVVRDGGDQPAAVGSLACTWRELPDGSVLRFGVDWELAPDEELYGLGERFDGPGLRGGVWDVRVYEEYKEQGRRTYVPVPFFVSSRSWGAWIDSDAPSLLDARGDRAAFTVDADPARPSGASLTWYVLVADDPYGVTSTFTALTGAIALPPSWAYGPWMSANGWNSQEKVQEVARRTLEEDVPATVMVIEAWSDESTFYVFNDAQYPPVAGDERLRLDDVRFGGRWPDPKAMVDELHENGMRLLLWQIPVQKQLEEPHPQHDADEAHMLEKGYMIRDGDGAPYRNKGWWFTDALVLDVTNPDACAWWFDKRRYLFEDLGIDGMKTDGGEHLWGRDLRAANGQRGTELVNRYAQAYVDAYHDFVQRMTGGDGLTFSRAGYTGAQRSPAHWAGDENSTWSAFRASIQAGLSAGLAGISIWGWDIGGFSGEVPTPELYVRSAQMAAFCPVMQYHSELHDVSENRDRTPWNVAERSGDPRALAIYRAYAKLRMRLLDYVAGEAKALAEAGRPLMRYPGLVWPEARERLMRDPDTYLFGRDLLVAPVLEKGAQTREVELPPGAWIDLWSGVRFDGGGRVLVPAPLERMPVFVDATSPRLDLLRDAAAPFAEEASSAGGGGGAGS